MSIPQPTSNVFVTNQIGNHAHYPAIIEAGKLAKRRVIRNIAGVSATITLGSRPPITLTSADGNIECYIVVPENADLKLAPAAIMAFGDIYSNWGDPNNP